MNRKRPHAAVDVARADARPVAAWCDHGARQDLTLRRPPRSNCHPDTRVADVRPRTKLADAAATENDLTDPALETVDAAAALSGELIRESAKEVDGSTDRR